MKNANPLELEERIDEPDCVFCKIVHGYMPAHKVYEDDNFLGFLDIRPLNNGHVELVPKKHYRWVYDVPNFSDYFEAAKRIIAAQIQSLQPESVSLATLGHHVPHAHIQLIPRFKGDGHGGAIDWKNVKIMTDDEIRATAEKISNAVKYDKFGPKTDAIKQTLDNIQRDVRGISETFK